VGEHVEEVDPGREAGWERAEGQMTRPRHVGRGPPGPRRRGGRPQRQPVIAADEIARRRAQVIAAARGEVGELQRDADGVVHHVADRPARARRLQRQLAGPDQSPGPDLDAKRGEERFRSRMEA
jgi:hypothetical protein